MCNFHTTSRPGLYILLIIILSSVWGISNRLDKLEQGMNVLLEQKIASEESL